MLATELPSFAIELVFFDPGASATLLSHDGDLSS
jgi:hypothetical protein